MAAGSAGLRDNYILGDGRGRGNTAARSIATPAVRGVARKAHSVMHRNASIGALIGALVPLIGCVPRPARPPRPERLVPVIPAPHVTRPGPGSWIAPDTLEVFVADT